MKISVPARYRIECDVKRGRYLYYFGINDVFEVDIAEATAAEAKEVISGAYFVGPRTDRFSRVQYETGLYEPKEAAGKVDALVFLKLAAEKVPEGPKYKKYEATFDGIPPKVREVHWHNRDAVELAINEAARDLLFVDGVLHRRSLPPVTSVSLYGRPFIPGGSFDDSAEIVLGSPSNHRDRRATFLFDVAHREQARELANLAKAICPKATFYENTHIVISAYDVPASFHQARHAAKVALSELVAFMAVRPSHPSHLIGAAIPTFSEAIEEAERLKGLLALPSHDPDMIFRRTKKMMEEISATPFLKPHRVQALQGLFSLAEFAMTNSPNDLSLIAADDPELADFDF